MEPMSARPPGEPPHRPSVVVASNLLVHDGSAWLPRHIVCAAVDAQLPYGALIVFEDAERAQHADGRVLGPYCDARTNVAPAGAPGFAVPLDIVTALDRADACVTIRLREEAWGWNSGAGAEFLLSFEDSAEAAEWVEGVASAWANPFLVNEAIENEYANAACLCAEVILKNLARIPGAVGLIFGFLALPFMFYNCAISFYVNRRITRARHLAGVRDQDCEYTCCCLGELKSDAIVSTVIPVRSAPLFSQAPQLAGAAIGSGKMAQLHA